MNHLHCIFLFTGFLLPTYYRWPYIDQCLTKTCANPSNHHAPWRLFLNQQSLLCKKSTAEGIFSPLWTKRNYHITCCHEQNPMYIFQSQKSNSKCQKCLASLIDISNDVWKFLNINVRCELCCIIKLIAEGNIFIPVSRVANGLRCWLRDDMQILVMALHYVYKCVTKNY